MDTHIGNTGLLVKIPTYILEYTRNTHMVTHAVILSAAKDLLACNTKPTPDPTHCGAVFTNTAINHFYVILSAAKDLLTGNAKPTSPHQSLRRGLYTTWQSLLLTNKPQ